MDINSLTQNLGKFVLFLLSPMNLKSGDFAISGPIIFVLPTLLLLIVLSMWSFIWLFRDARKRGKNGALAIVFILITGWPLSFIWWFWLRPAADQNGV